ncbi:MAG: histidinol-phosphate transaminase [Pyrinomonadaceae bacterium]
MKFELDALVRLNIQKLKPYSSARQEFSGVGDVFLDANENSFGSPALEQNFNRYPDPLQTEIKRKLAKRLDLSPNEIFVGNGSDEAIDLLFRVFCRPAMDQVIITPPTYGMYEVSANINDIAVKSVFLTEKFELNEKAVLDSVTQNTKLIFLCSPNNPTGNNLKRRAILEIAENFNGILVVDEAYIHFSSEKSLVGEIKNNPNLVVLQTFSKAWGMAGLRVGLALADAPVIEYLNKVKPPYNISEIAQKTLFESLENGEAVKEVVLEIIKERKGLSQKLIEFSFVLQIFPSDANFLLVKTTDANGIYRFLVEQGIIVRNRSNIELCEDCLRITIGTPEENRVLIKALENYK